MSQNSKNDDQFQVLVPVPTPDSSTQQTKTQPAQSKQKLENAFQVYKEQKKSDCLDDQLVVFEKQEDRVNLCIKCNRCLELEEKLRNYQLEKQILTQSLMQSSKQLKELESTQLNMKQQCVDKTQLNFCIESLKQMLKSYKEQDQRIKKFLSQTLKLKAPQIQKSTYSLIDSIITDYLSNGQELDRDLSHLIVLSSPTGEGAMVKQDSTSSYTYNYYETSAKVEKIRENIVELQKMLR